MEKSNIGLVGLAVMGSNLIRNIAGHGYSAVVYNRTKEKTDKFISEFGNENLIPSYSYEELVSKLERPKKIILMVKSGDPVDAVINSLKDYLEPGDIIIDGGNSHYKDTIRREVELRNSGIHFLGCGISGGEEGALTGPSMMPGGSAEAWKNIKPIFESIAAKDFSGNPCVTHIGENGAGHFVKMVHNGIEYGIMQLIAEVYEFLKNVYCFDPHEIANVFDQLNNGVLKSYLFEITVEVLNKEDDLESGYLIDKVLDKAGNKGTGKWTVQDALDRGLSINSIGEAVNSRFFSEQKELRNALAQDYKKLSLEILRKSEQESIKSFIQVLEPAIYITFIVNFLQGFDLIETASNEENWDIDLSEVVRIWQGGCIIRADVLKEFRSILLGSNNLLAIWKSDFLKDLFNEKFWALKHIVQDMAHFHVYAPVLGGSLNYLLAKTRHTMSTNMIQILRDRFGSHTYKRIDREGDFHTEW